MVKLKEAEVMTLEPEKVTTSPAWAVLRGMNPVGVPVLHSVVRQLLKGRYTTLVENETKNSDSPLVGSSSCIWRCWLCLVCGYDLDRSFSSSALFINLACDTGQIPEGRGSSLDWISYFEFEITFHLLGAHAQRACLRKTDG